jgi:ankyrin repeat protein
VEPSLRPRHTSAVYAHDVGAIRQLLQARTSVADEEAAIGGLLAAIEIDSEEIVGVYLDARLSLDKRDSSGLTPLTAAALAGRIGVVRRLLAAGADVNLATFDGMTALHHAALRNDRKMLEVLVEHGADVASRNCEGDTALDLSLRHQFILRWLPATGFFRRPWTSTSTRYLKRAIAR